MTNRMKATTYIIVTVLVFALVFAMAFALVPNTLTASAAANVIEWTQADMAIIEDSMYDGDSREIKGITFTVHDGYYSPNYSDEYWDDDRGEYVRVFDYCSLSGDSDEKSFSFSIGNGRQFSKIELMGDWVNGYPSGDGWNGYTWTGESSEVILNGYADYVNWIRFTLVPTVSTVTLNPNGGTVNSGDITSYSEGIGATLPTNVTKEGDTFRGWYNNPLFYGNPVVAISNEETGAKTYWAKWDNMYDYSEMIETDKRKNAYSGERLSVSAKNAGDDDGAAIIRDTNITVSTTTNGKIHSVALILTYNQDRAGMVTSNKGTRDAIFSFEGATYVVFKDIDSISVSFGTNNTWVYVRRIIANYNDPILSDVTLHDNDGTINSGDVEQYTEGVAVNLPTDVTREGYVFQGWYDNASFTGNAVTKIGTDAKGTQEFWARWAPTITYDVGGGQINGNHATWYVEGEGATLPSNVTREGFDFGGWYGNAELTGDPVASIDTNAEGPKTYWAKWLAFYVVGSMNEWEILADNRLIRNANASGEEYSLVTTFAAQDEFKVVYGASGDKRVWYPDGMDNNYRIAIGEEYRVYFRPNGDGGDGWHYNVIFIKMRGADDTDILISAIGEVVNTAECKAKIDLARASYESLNSTQKGAVIFYATLTNAEERYALIKEADDIQGAEDTTELIETLPDVDKLIRKDNTAVLAAKEAYDALSPEGKALVAQDLVAKLDAAVEVIDALEAQYPVAMDVCGHVTFALDAIASSSGINIDKTYTNNIVGNNPVGVKVHHPKSGSYAVQGYSIITISFYVEEARTIAFYWGFEYQDGYAHGTVTINHNGRGIGTYKDNNTRGDGNGADWTNNSWKIYQASCPAGWNKLTFRCQVESSSWQERDEGRCFYVLFNGFATPASTFDGDTCTLCGTVCTHDSLTLELEGGKYVYKCNDLCHNTISLTNISYDNKAAIASARAAYEALSDGEKTKVPQETLAVLETKEQQVADLETAEPIADVINALPRLSALTIDDKDAVLAAQEAFEALSDEQKGMIPLESAHLDAALQRIADIELAILLDSTINALPDPADITLDNKEAVMTAVATFEALSPAQKIKVPQETFVKLRAAEKKINDIETANDFIAKQNAIGEVAYTDDCHEAIELARDAYNALSAEGRVLAGDNTTLTKAEADYAGFAQAAINALIGDLNVAELTIDNKDAILEAKDAFDALSSEEQAYISAETSAKVEALVVAMGDVEEASAVADVINALPQVEDVMLEDGEDVEAAREAYEALSDQAKNRVPTEALAKLEALLAELNAIEAVVDAIDALPAPEDIVLGDKDAVVAAKGAYEDLTDEQRFKLPQELLAKLGAAEQEIIAAEAADGVSQTINALPAEVTLDDEAAVEAAGEAYEALSNKAKGKVPQETLAKLQQAQQSIVDIKAANAFLAKMNAIGEVDYDEDSKHAIEEARVAYNALTPEQKALVGEITVLTDAEDAFVTLATEEIEELLDLDEISLDDKDDVMTAKEAFDSMTPEEQALVSQETIAKLNAAVKEIEDTETANAAIDDIIDLPEVGELSLDDKEDVIAAREAYQALTPDQKAKVSQETLAVLAAAEKEIEDIEESNEATQEIVDLPEVGELSLEDKEDVEAAREAYEALSAEGKAKVSQETLAVLAAAEKEIVDIEESNEATAGIVELPAVGELSLENKEAVEAAREAYNDLSAEGKAKVSQETLAMLAAAEKEIENIGESNAATATITELPAVGELSLENKEAVEAAREAYNDLSAEGKAKVSQETLAVLAAAEKEIVDIEESNEATATITELPATDNVSIDNKQAIVQARAAYNALSNEGKAKVSQETIAKLAAAESVIAEIESIVVNKDKDSDTTTYAKEITAKAAEEGVNVKQLFKEAAKDASQTKEVEIKAGDTSVTFDAAAVNAIGDKDTTFSVKVSDKAPEGVEMQIDLELNGATFAEGKATISTKFDKAVPKGKKVSVYHLADGIRTAVKSWLSGGKLFFETNHFSTYVVVFEDAKTGLSGGAIAGIVIGCFFGLLLIACAVLFILHKKGIVKLAFVDAVCAKFGKKEQPAENDSDNDQTDEPIE